MRHEHQTQLRWSDADMLGHLNHARLLVQTWAARLGTRSLTLQQELSRAGRAVLRCDAICVCFDYEADTSRPMDDDERTFWTAYLEKTPAAGASR